MLKNKLDTEMCEKTLATPTQNIREPFSHQSSSNEVTWLKLYKKGQRFIFFLNLGHNCMGSRSLGGKRLYLKKSEISSLQMGGWV